MFEDISSEDLVPGDVIEVPRNGCVMQCDAVLLSGNVIVNESMLTGKNLNIQKSEKRKKNRTQPEYFILL